MLETPPTIPACAALASLAGGGEILPELGLGMRSEGRAGGGLASSVGRRELAISGQSTGHTNVPSTGSDAT